MGAGNRNNKNKLSVWSRSKDTKAQRKRDLGPIRKAKRHNMRRKNVGSKRTPYSVL